MTTLQRGVLDERHAPGSQPTTGRWRAIAPWFGLRSPGLVLVPSPAQRVPGR